MEELRVLVKVLLSLAHAVGTRHRNVLPKALLPIVDENPPAATRRKCEFGMGGS